MIDPTIRNINRLFLQSFKVSVNDPIKNCFDMSYMPQVEFKNFNALFDNKPFYDQPIKNKQEVYKKLVEVSGNDDYATGNLLDYLYHQKY